MATDHAPLQHFFKQQDLNKWQTQWRQELVDTPISIVSQPGPSKPQFLMHYLAVLSFMSLWMRVLILSPQLLVRSCSVPFVANSMLMMIRMQIMHPRSISITSVGATLALAMLLLVWQPMSLQNTTQVHVIPCWWSHNSCNAYQIHFSNMLLTVR